MPFGVRLVSLLAVLLSIWLVVCQSSLHYYGKLQRLSQEIAMLERQAKRLEKHKEIQSKVQEILRRSSSDYLAHVVEPMMLLQEERKRASLLSQQFPDNFSLKERLLFLDSDQNRIRFEKSSENSSYHIEYRMMHPAQMDLNNLKKFLELLEGDRYDTSQGKPFLLMKKFDLRKCYEKGDEKVYSIYVELLQKI